MRLAWFTPWAPQASGIAGRSAELVPKLAALGHGIDVFVDDRSVPVDRAPDGPPERGIVRVQSAHEFVWRVARGQYDLPVYQLGNSRLNEFIWPYVLRWPGLAVLHDARLHHARARAHLSPHQVDRYRREFTWSHYGVGADAAELAIRGFGGPYYYQWPMTRAVVEASRYVAAHTRGGAAELEDTWDRPVAYVRLGEGRRVPITESDRESARRRWQIRPTDVVFGVFGALTPEKRLAQILPAFKTTRLRWPEARLFCAGPGDAMTDITQMAAALDISDAVSVLGPLDEMSFDQAIAAVDVSLHLRWPTAVETSGPWLRALAAARATVITELAHQSHVPALDPRTWRPYPGVTAPPIAVAVDILDEDHSLRQAMHRLAADPALRAALGREARCYWEIEHTVEEMVHDYEHVLAVAVEAPERPATLPRGLLAEPDWSVNAVLEPFGNAICAFS